MTSPPDLVVRPIETQHDLKVFIELPVPLYASDPLWVQPLSLEQRQHLSDRHNPYFEHAQWRAWVAWRGQRPVGRISAQIDQLFLECHHDRTGFFGMLEAEDDPEIFRQLFATAEGWLRQQGMEQVLGPFNLSINQQCGLLVEGFDTPPSVMMPHGRPYYEGRILAEGYIPAKDLLAYRIAPDFQSPKVMTALLKKYAGRLLVRPLRRKDLAAELDVLRDIFNDAWSANWGFVPFTEAEFRALGRDLMRVVDRELVQLAELEGEPVAFVVVLPNIHEAIRDLHGRLFPVNWVKLLWRLKVRYPRSARVALMGVRRRFHNSRLGPGLAFLVIDAVRQEVLKRGVREVEMSWILEENAAMRNIIETLGGEIYKRYRIFQKRLARAQT